jgi:cytochrome c5
MLRRIFWLAVAAAGGWLMWWWLRQRQAEFSDHTPQFAPSRPYTPPAPATPPAPDPDEALADAGPANPPAAESAAPPIALDAPEAPPAVAAATLDELFADEPAAPPASAQASQPTPADEPTAPAAGEPTGALEVEGYCMRCHAKRPIQGAREEISESGRRAARGTCPVCGTNMFRFLATNGDD